MTANAKLDLILSEMKDMKTEMQDMKTEIQEMKTDITGINTEIHAMKTDITGINTEIHAMKTDITEIRQKVTKIELTIENEIRVNIQRVAEGHLDLSRNLNECIRLSSEVKDKQEIQDILINMHNTKLMAL